MNIIKTYYSVALFIGFFIFIPFNNTLLNMDKIGLPTVGTVIPLLFIGLVLIFLDFRNFRNFLFFKVPLSALFFLISSIMIILQSYILGTATYVPEIYLTTKNIFWFVYSSAGFLLSYYFVYWINFFKESKLTLYIGSFLGVGILILLFSEYNLYQILSRKIFDEVSISYQMVSDLIVISSTLLLAKIDSGKFFIFLVIVSTIIILFILGSRSSILFYMISLILFASLNLKAKQVFIILVASIMLFMLFYASLLNWFSNDTRTLSLLTGDYANANSIIERNVLLNINLVNIYSSWFTGNIYGEFLTTNKQGTYIHNYLSYLQNFGFIPFIILNMIFFKISFLLLKYKSNFFEYRFIFIIFFFAMFSMLISRSYTSMYFLIPLIISEGFINSLIEKNYYKRI